MKKMYKKIQILTLLVSVSIGFEMCQNNSEKRNEKLSEYVFVNGQNFIDPFGREIILQGINLVNKNKNENYLGSDGSEVFKDFKNWGFNCVRLGIIWDGLEPEPGVYNEDYLQGVDQQIQWAQENDIYVILDMHQDLYSVKYSDGAPEWATIDEGQPHVRGAIWSDSYLMSPAVQISFDNFWKNTAVSDGVGVQDHYVNAWKHVAERYADNKMVIGFDIMNEPFMGSSANEVMPMLLGSYAMVIAEETGNPPPGAEELMAIWSNEESRLEALKNIAEAEKYQKVIDAVYEINAKFESTILSDFYQKVRDEIRQVNKHHILFFEHSYFSNTGIYSAFKPVVDEKGVQDPLQAYAAHGYDLLTDTKEVENPSYERVELIFERIAETSRRMNMPVFLGEWGAYHSQSSQMVRTADHSVSLIEKLKFSNTFWAHYHDISTYAYFNHRIIRPYPSKISGKLISYKYDMNTGEFDCSWEEEAGIEEPTRLYIPNLSRFSEENVWIEPESEKIIIESISDSGAGYLIISPIGGAVTRNLKIKFSDFEATSISLN